MYYPCSGSFSVHVVREGSSGLAQRRQLDALAQAEDRFESRGVRRRFCLMNARVCDLGNRMRSDDCAIIIFGILGSYPAESRAASDPAKVRRLRTSLPEDRQELLVPMRPDAPVSWALPNNEVIWGPRRPTRRSLG